MDRYTARINLRGTTQRERTLNRFRDTLETKLPESLSSKPIKLNGIDADLIINSSTQPYYKEFQSYPGQEINIGDYVEWAHSHWIVTSCDYDDEIYRDGKLEQCNYLLKWQNEKGEIIERWSIIKSASKYNDGTTSNEVIILGSDQLSVVIPVDAETIKLKKSMGKKFFIDNNKDNPTVYELTNPGNVPDTYNGHGITSWIVKECAYTPTREDLKYGVCDYKPPREHVRPNITDKTKVLFAKILGSDRIKCGYSKGYKVFFEDENKNKITDCDFKWNIVSDFKIKSTIAGDSVELLAEDEDYIGSSFLLQILDAKNAVLTEKEILITGAF